MAIIPLTDTQSCINFFQESVLINLRCWQECDAIKSMDLPTLDREQARIIRAISFAFRVEDTGSSVRELIISLSPYMERRDYSEAWHWVVKQAIEAARQVEDLAGAALLSLLLARLLQRQGQFKATVGYYRQTIRLARQMGDETLEARACSNLGFLYTERGLWHRAELLCCHALAIFERTNSHHGRAHTENHLGFLYTRRCRWEAAQQHLLAACEIWYSMSDHHGLMRGLINLGVLSVEMKRPDVALLYLERALEQANLAGEETEIAKIYLNMGVAYRLLARPAMAEAYAWRAEAIFRRYANSVGLAEVQDNLGLACLDQQKWEEAKLHLETALQAWRTLENKLGQFRVFTYLIEYELARDNRSQATKWLAEAEKVNLQFGQQRDDAYRQSLLMKYRRSLIER